MNKKGWIIVSVILVILIGGGVWFYFSNKNNNNKVENYEANRTSVNSINQSSNEIRETAKKEEENK